jgi:hypothetical protein
MEALDIGIVDVARPPSRLQQKQRVGVQRDNLEVVRILLRDLAHGLCVGPVLFAPF